VFSFTFVFIKPVNIKDGQYQKLDYTNITFIPQGAEIDNISGNILIEFQGYAKEYPRVPADHIIRKSNNNERFYKIIRQTVFRLNQQGSWQRQYSI